MENDHLRILTDKTWDLQGRINDTINERLQSSFSICSHCSNHGRYCVVASPEKSSTLEEREKMVVLRDSLKDLHTILIFLQRVKASQKRQREEAFGRLEESRKLLIERINQYCSENERGNVVGSVLEEIIRFVGDDENFKWNSDKKIVEQKKKSLNNGLFGFIVDSTRFGVEFLVMFASIYTGFKLCENRLEKEVVPPLLDSDIHFDVFCGRG